MQCCWVRERGRGGLWFSINSWLDNAHLSLLPVVQFADMWVTSGWADNPTRSHTSHLSIVEHTHVWLTKYGTVHITVCVLRWALCSTQWALWTQCWADSIWCTEHVTGLHVVWWMLLLSVKLIGQFPFSVCSNWPVPSTVILWCCPAQLCQDASLQSWVIHTGHPTSERCETRRVLFGATEMAAIYAFKQTDAQRQQWEDAHSLPKSFQFSLGCH